VAVHLAKGQRVQHIEDRSLTGSSIHTPGHAGLEKLLGAVVHDVALTVRRHAQRGLLAAGHQAAVANSTAKDKERQLNRMRQSYITLTFPAADRRDPGT